jgi:high-affinity iron transporter
MLSLSKTLRKTAPVLIGSFTIFALTVFVSGEMAFSQGDLIRGRALYGMNCAICHGESGKGDGPRGATLQPKPINLTDPKMMEAIPPERFERAVVAGLPNVTGHGFGHLLTPEEIKNVTDYVRSLSRR